MAYDKNGKMVTLRTATEETLVELIGEILADRIDTVVEKLQARGLSDETIQSALKGGFEFALFHSELDAK
jgi:DNA-binding transcriptional regulator YhcF (GntR family)